MLPVRAHSLGDVATSASVPWDPAQYRRFERERAQPFHDLLDLIRPPTPTQPIQRAVDLGCGSGELTAIAAARFGVGEMVGIDSSAEMLEAAAASAADQPGVRFERGDIGQWTGSGGIDLVLANASLQWVPDHRAVLARWTAALRAGGQLAVQVPDNAGQPSHVVAAAVASSARYADAFGPEGPPVDRVAVNVLEPEEYATILHDLGFVDQHVRLQVYPHLLDHSRDVVEWVRGTTLNRFRAVLAPDVFDEFVAEYEERLLATIGEHAPYLFPFRRILLWGRLPGVG